MNIQKELTVIIGLLILVGCTGNQAVVEETPMALEVKDEFIRTWDAYKTYAWGHDVLLPLSKGHKDWYKESLHISPIDAYSTIMVMGLTDEAALIEEYIMDSVSWEKDLFVKTFEVNIRILGGMLAMYEYSGKQEILDKTEDFGKRMLRAFDSPTGIPYYWFNLKTGETKGEQVNVAEAATYLVEMGILSYYTQNPVYYQAAKKANLAIWNRVSEIKLVGEYINVETGKWTKESSHICAGIDSYYEYLIKAWLLFGDEDLKPIWDQSINAVNTYLAEESDSSLWYGRVDMHTGEKLTNPMSESTPEVLEGNIVTLYDAFFPAVLVLNKDIERADKFQETFDWLWNKYGLEPTIFDFGISDATYPLYDLNPEIIESAYYLYHATGDEKYMDMIHQYWKDLLQYCKTDVAFASVENVKTMKKRDYMPTYFLAETLKYFYLAFNHETGIFNPDDYIFNTEAHPFLKTNFEKEKIGTGLGI